LQTGSREVILNISSGDIISVWSVQNGGIDIIISEASESGLTIKKLS